jgi:hypothetical protein
MNGNSTVPRISPLKRATWKRSSAKPIPNTVLAARVATVKTMVFCNVCRKIGSTTEVVEPQKASGVADTGVTQAEQNPQHERIGDEHDEKEECRCNERVGNGCIAT